MPSPLPPTAPAFPRRLVDATRNGFAATRAGFAGGRAHAGRIGHHARDMFAPLIAVQRGLRRATRRGHAWWSAAATNHRQAAAVGLVATLVLLYFVPYGLPGALAVVVLGAAWLGRTRRTPAVPGPPPGGHRLQAVYNGLVPHLSDGHDPEELFAPGGDYAKPFEHHEFEGDRLTRLEMRYSPFFTDDDPASRARIERVIEAKVGRCREYLYDWDTENNRLTVAALPPLPGPVPAQRYVTAPCEIVLGFTDATSTNRLIPVMAGTAGPAGPEGAARELPPVIWRAGSRTSAPHMLVVAGPASGKTTLLRTIALQALRDGEVIAMDATGSGEFAYLAGRAGVLRTDNTPDQIRTTLSWLHAEAARRAAAISAAKAAATPVPDAVRRPLLVLLDEPAELADAAGTSVSEVYELLDLPLRLGRTTHISLVTTARPSRLGRLHPGLLAETHTRIALGPLDADTLVTALGTEPGIAGGDTVPPGRGYARIGAGPVIRIQTPYTPDPLEDDTPEADRMRILDLLPDVVLRGLPRHAPVTPNAHVTGGAVVTKAPAEPVSSAEPAVMSLTKSPLTKTR
ncbi:ATP-binding protein [Yinghuangia sp. ASG 101]|uniref:ATP-binding protein n=1 Tax=Yinghuangia sp. ASG 101 TaxID=2896848 RepID=UPI001E371E33|nr:ATP-binding protein [Yinghuangia sp. ASG 101]UGQ12247.1 ATP-binding protein [Yinghuangia sp. ASG 101]